MLGLSSKSVTAVLFLLFLGVVHAAPLATEKRSVNTSVRLARDDENLSQPTTVQTTNTIQTAVGPMLQTCTITLTPISGDNGEPLVRETKSCSLSMTSSGNNASGSDSGSSDSASSASSTDSAAASQTDASASATATDGASSAAATAASTGAIGVNGASEIPGSALSTGATDSAAATATSASDSTQATATAGTGGAAVSAGGFSSVDQSAVATETAASASASATATPSGTGTAVGDAANTPTSATSAADTASSSPAASFQLPGTKLSVLPIGLGVFAGISVIALIVVGLVTYERTKYRKAFRQRKLAESGAAMGYGGMA
ncbi:hypothetical protein C2E23DRAFT_869377 [Lenzites betulinus]|nr:hypothetical protein C2E23DRAFT_869377 [Lenzites betulinus]